MAKTFHLTLAKLGENVFDGEAVSVTLPGAKGVFTVLPGHEAFVSMLASGEAVFVTKDGEKKHIELSGGLCEVSGQQVTVLL